MLDYFNNGNMRARPQSAFYTLATKATTLAGAPLPPLIFIGKTCKLAPTYGNLSTSELRFSIPYMPALRRIRWAMKSFTYPGSREAETKLIEREH